MYNIPFNLVAHLTSMILQNTLNINQAESFPRILYYLENNHDSSMVSHSFQFWSPLFYTNSTEHNLKSTRLAFSTKKVSLNNICTTLWTGMSPNCVIHSYMDSKELINNSDSWKFWQQVAWYVMLYIGILKWSHTLSRVIQRFKIAPCDPWTL